jgi:hypothetical protein
LLSSLQKLKKRIKTKQFWLTVAPLLILLVTVGVYNLTIARRAVTAVATHATPTPLPTTQTPHSTSTSTRPPILPATILPSPTPTNTPLPDIPETPTPGEAETAVITLFGPPNESSLPLNGRLAFYWSYPAPLPPGQQFVLTLRQKEVIHILGVLDHPNFGDSYQIQVDFEPVETVVGTAVWQVQLRWSDEEHPLLTSEVRQITFLPE